MIATFLYVWSDFKIKVLKILKCVSGQSLEIPLGVDGIIFPSFFEWLPNEVAFLVDRKVTISLEIQTEDDLCNH